MNSINIIRLMLIFIISVASIFSEAYGEESLRPWIIEAISEINKSRKSGGYDLSSYFSQDLKYGKLCCIQTKRPLKKDPGPNPTMCVAGVSEVIIEALNKYGEAKNDYSFSDKLSKDSWTRGNIGSIRANLFMYKGTGSNGTASALEKLGLGRQKVFSELKPGDFVNFNRTTNSGHAVVFTGYLEKDKRTPVENFSSNVVGFQYFSAQGKNRPDGGFGYRNAYFVNNCPSPRNRDDDCNIIKVSEKIVNGKLTQNQVLFNSGELFVPDKWTTEIAQNKIRYTVTRGFEEDGLTRGFGLEEAVNKKLEEELSEDFNQYDDGSEQL